MLLTLSSCGQKSNLIKKTEDKYEMVDGKNTLVGQIVHELRPIDSLPVTKLTKVFNYEDNARLRYLTGFSKKDGLQPYLLDSIFYDKNGNDTLTKSFVKQNSIWQPTQLFHKLYRADNKVSYFMTERPFDKDHYFKNEIVYIYNENGNLVSETEFMCRQKATCDSTIKKQYTYKSDGKLDSTILYSWKDGKWKEIKKRNGR